MHTITLQKWNIRRIENDQSLETKHFVKVVDNSEIDSPASPGKRLSITEFRNWIKNAEQTPAVPFSKRRKNGQTKESKFGHLPNNPHG